MMSSPVPATGPADESFTVEQIRQAFRDHAHPGDWGVDCFYEDGLLAALRGEFAIGTKPFNVHQTVLYTIVNFYNGWRGPDNLVFGFGYETPRQIAENMARLEAGEIELSNRRYLPLHIDSVNNKPIDYDHFTALLWDGKRRWQREHVAAMAKREVAQ